MISAPDFCRILEIFDDICSMKPFIMLRNFYEAVVLDVGDRKMNRPAIIVEE